MRGKIVDDEMNLVETSILILKKSNVPWEDNFYCINEKTNKEISRKFQDK